MTSGIKVAQVAMRRTRESSEASVFDLPRPESWSFIVASNDDEVLGNSFLRSPGLGAVREIIVQQGYNSAAGAYNSGRDKSSGEVLVFVHQDVFLPEEWSRAFSDALRWLQEYDPDWGVLGCFGRTAKGLSQGHVHSVGLQQTLGSRFFLPAQVRLLDELLLVVRRSSGLRFDEALPGFHLYGTDICLESERRGMRNYVIPAFCIHNSNRISWLPTAFWKAFLHTRRKWWHELPLHSPCIQISRSLWPVVHYFCWKTGERLWSRPALSKRCSNPAELCKQLAEKER